MVSSGGVMNYDESKPWVNKCRDGTLRFREDQKQYTSCKVASGPVGELFCTDPPCDYSSQDCNWQIGPSFDINLSPGHFYELGICKRCSTQDCNKKYAHTRDNECGQGGVWRTINYGTTWYCDNQNCKGQMKEKSNKKGYYECKDEKCWGTGKLDDENYRCKDPTCASAGGFMQWIGDNSIDGKWSCINNKCDSVDQRLVQRMVQKNDGWVCEAPSCPGKLLQKAEGAYYECVDPKCKGSIAIKNEGSSSIYYCKEDNTNPMYYIVGGLVFVGIIGFVVMKNKQKKLEHALKNHQV